MGQIKTKTHKDCANPECGKEFKLFRTTDKCCSLECLKKFSKPKEFKPFTKVSKVSKTNKVIQNEKSLSQYKADLQQEINLIVRLIDKGHNCICNQNKRIKLLTAGHYFSIGSNPTLRFHLLNIWGQDFDSNGINGGEPIEFKEGLLNLYGNDCFDKIESLKSIKLIDLNVNEVKDKIYISRSIVKWLKLQDRKFSISERWELRIKFNSELGIY